MPIQAPLDYVIDCLRRDDAQVERRMLRDLTGTVVPADEARALWPRLLDHKWFMSERMGRDVGLRVAAIDFFEHVEPRSPAGRRQSRAASRVRMLVRAVFVDPVAWLHRILTDFTETLRGASAVVGFIL